MTQRPSRGSPRHILLCVAGLTPQIIIKFPPVRVAQCRFVDILSQKCLTSTRRVLTEKTPFSIRSLSICDDISTLTARTMEEMEHHQRLSSA